MSRKFEYIGTLPAGKWRFLLVEIEGDKDALFMVEQDGCYAPRMVIDGKLVEAK